MQLIKAQIFFLHTSPQFSPQLQAVRRCNYWKGFFWSKISTRSKKTAFLGTCAISYSPHFTSEILRSRMQKKINAKHHLKYKKSVPKCTDARTVKTFYTKSERHTTIVVTYSQTCLQQIFSVRHYERNYLTKVNNL